MRAAVTPLAVGLLGAGALVALALPQLPARGWIYLTLLAAPLLWFVRWSRWLGWIGLGGAWALLHAGWALDARLPRELEARDVVLTVQIDGLPETRPRLQRFDAQVLAGEGAAAVLKGRRLRLSWYDDRRELRPGEIWRLPLRLKRPRGVLNPGGFDFERHALVLRLAATGYVREGAVERLAAAGGIDAARDAVARRLAAAQVPGTRFLQGLAVGDTRGLADSDWEVLRASGLSHLLAISGLHIGLVAGFGALFVRLAYRLRPRLGLRWPRPQAAAAAALLFATAYSALAGFGLPTQRTLVMLAAALAGVLLRRRVGGAQALALAALSILLIDPLALLGAGFWLSFAGVAWLLLCMPLESGLHAAARSLLRAQLAMTLGLLPLTLWFFGQASLLGAVLNLVAVPWVNFVVVPLTLLGTLLLPLTWLATPLLWLAGQGMEALWWLAQAGLRWPYAQFHLPEAGWPALLCALLGVLWLLLPRGVPGKPLAALLLLPQLWPRLDVPEAGALRLDVLDVGQGLAVLLRTADHALLFDAGPAYAGGLDLGEAAVVPALRALAVERLDRLVLSHGDNDHAGGANALRRAFPHSDVIAGEVQRSAPARPCQAGERWTWDGVAFEWLHPPQHFPELRNQSSCVLRVATANATLLLPGDIDATIEQRLLARDLLGKIDLVLVPHHGSGGSSSAEFVARLQPRYALISAGARNRFGHPRPEIVQRYRDVGAELASTAQGGALRVEIAADGRIQLAARRQTQRRLWHETASPD